jgi:glycosyltransferase involved in cell wall biosynthesis
MDFCNSDNVWLIDYEFEYSQTHLDTFSSVWAKPSDSHLSQLLKEVYNSSSSTLSTKIQAAKESISKYKWDYVAKINRDFVFKLNSASTFRKPTIGVISTWKTRCGIATYSEHLFSNFEDECIIFSPKITSVTSDSHEESIRCWDIGNDDLSNLFNNIIDKNITSILIQFNYGFFDFISLSKFLKKVSDRNINIIMILHSTIDPKDNPSKKISLIANELALCNRLLVHSVSDLNRLKDLNLIDNVSLFPHGILESNIFKRKNDYKKYANQELHFSTFGFCLPNKGFEELIKSISILRNNNICCRLTLYTSLYDSNVSEELLQKLNLLIQKLNLTGYVRINSSFLTDDQIFKNLSSTDLVVFPYQSTNESASGAARQAVSAMVPVAVTPLPIFQDITDVVYTLPGCSPTSIASGLVEWIDNFYGVPMTKNEIIWRKQHSYKILSSRLQGMIRSLEINN